MRFIPDGHWVALMISPYRERWARTGEHVKISRKVEYRTGINVVWSRWRITTLPSWGRNKCIASPRRRTNSNVGVPSLKMWGSLTSLLTIVASACCTSSTVIERCCKAIAGWLHIFENRGYLTLSPSYVTERLRHRNESGRIIWTVAFNLVSSNCGLWTARSTRMSNKHLPDRAMYSATNLSGQFSWMEQAVQSRGVASATWRK